MLQSINPTETRSWTKLTDHFKTMRSVKMTDLFSQDPDRFSRFSRSFEDMLVDYSKNRMTQKTLDMLLELAQETQVKAAIDALVSGQKINETEGRSVLHTALRHQSSDPILTDG
jgi:glucose-6-phosphate isomerase